MDSSANLYKQLVDYDANRKNSVDVLNDSMAKYGIPEIRSRVSGLRTTLSNTENALNAVDPSVTGRTQGSLVTEAQRQRQVANERAPITEQYGQQSRALQTESANLSDNLSAAQLIAQNQIADYDKGRAAISDKYNLALGAEAEQRRREEADRVFRLQEQQAADARRAAAASVGYNLGGGGGSAKPAGSGVSIPPGMQQLYNQVFIKPSGGQWSDQALVSDYNATLKSAKNGNVRDKQKIELYHSVRPDLFGSAVSGAAFGNGGSLRF